MTTTPHDDAAHETERAQQTPLSVRFEVMGCEFANPDWSAGGVIPTYTFRPSCPFGKERPDQDCRLCSHHRIHVLGASEPYWRQRYHARGYVFPVADEETADALLAVLDAHDGAPLTRPDWGKPEGAE